MNKKLIVAVIILALVGFGIYTFWRDSQYSPTEEAMEPTKLLPAEKMMPESTDQIGNAGIYKDYEQADFESAPSDVKRVLFFHASWCPTCTIANADFVANSKQIPEDIVVYKTNYDEEKALKAKYNVTYQHTFVQVDAAGNAITKWNGGGVAELIRKVN